MNLSRDNCNIIYESPLYKNIKKGQIGEEIAKEDYTNHGYKIIPTGIGSDFIAIKKATESGKDYIEYVEVKTGKAKQSRRQNITMRKVSKEGKKYTIYRVSDAFLTTYLSSVPSSIGGSS